MDLKEKIGIKLKDIRQKSGLTILDLAQKSSVSSNMISRIERGLTVPSVEILVRLAGVFNRSISYFIEESGEDDNIVLTRKGEVTPLFFFEGKHRIDGVCMGLRDPSFSVFVDTIQPECSSGDGVMVHSGDEFLQVIEGSIEFYIENKHIRLSEGDSLFFKATLPHRWSNTCDGIAKILWVVSPPPQLVDQPHQFASGI